MRWQIDRDKTSHVDTFVMDGLPPDEQLPELVDVPELSYPERLNAAAELLGGAISRGFGTKNALVDHENCWNYTELDVWSNRIANVLVDVHGIAPGNRVVLRGINSTWMVAAWFAVLKAGAVAVATMPMLREAELQKIYSTARPTVALSEYDLDRPLHVFSDVPVETWGPSGTLAELMADASPDFSAIDTYSTDPALLGFTSGTTGVPKATIHFHRDLLAVADSFQTVLRAGPDDVFVGSPPLAFTFGLGGLVLFPTRVGASTAFASTPGPEGLAACIAQHRATVCFTAPTAYKAMLDLDPPVDLSSLRRCVSAGETLPLRTYESFLERTGLQLIDGIGATEMLHIFISAADDDIRPGSTGKPVLGFEAQVIDDDGEPVSDGTVGRLAVKGPLGCRYLSDARQQEYVVNGWNVTGDAFMRDSDGYFWYQARIDDMIVSSGYNIAGPEVEEALLSHPAVAEVGVFGSPDPDRGSLVRAVVRLADGFEASDQIRRELQEYVKASIAPYKYPRVIDFVADPLPKTATGKLQRKMLPGLVSS